MSVRHDLAEAVQSRVEIVHPLALSRVDLQAKRLLLVFGHVGLHLLGGAGGGRRRRGWRRFAFARRRLERSGVGMDAIDVAVVELVVAPIVCHVDAVRIHDGLVVVLKGGSVWGGVWWLRFRV